MTYRIELTFQAEKDIDQILNWLSCHSPQGAATWYRRWQRVLADLSANAYCSSLAPEDEDHPEPIRNLIFKTTRGRPYRAIFVIRENVVFITNVRGPGRDLIPPSELNTPECE